MPLISVSSRRIRRILTAQLLGMVWMAVPGCCTHAISRPSIAATDDSSTPDTRPGLLATPERSPDTTQSTVISFRRPSGCDEPRRDNGRKLVDCESEERRDIIIDAEGHVSTGEIKSEAPRNPYPVELVRQWRYCPFAECPVLDGLPNSFIAYDDADVGRCYIHREIDTAEVDALRSKARLGPLSELHPYLADATSRMIVAAAREGFQFKIISTNRPYTNKSVTITKVIKKGKKMVKVKRKTHGKGSSLHAWGLAVDVNVMHRNDLRSASSAYLTDENEHRMWERLGELGVEYGLIWLGPLDVGEIFHFEWRPGLSGRPAGDLLNQLKGLKAKGGYPAVWTLLKCPNPAKSLFKHLSDL